MTRQEQIKEAARQRADQYDHPSKWSDTYYGFIDGAKWADKHPHWIPVEEELPKEGQVVLIHTKGGEGENGWHFFVGCSKEISTEKYVKFCNYLQKALDVLNEKED